MSESLPRPLVSVVVPVYNVAAYLSQCVDSALAQSYDHLEIVLVDDGSTDGSSNLCDAYAQADSRVRVIHQENSGLSAARNVGMDSCTGSLITFLDGDDWWAPSFVESLTEALDEYPSAALAMSAFARVPGRPWTAHVDNTVLMSETEVVTFFAGPQHTLATMACAKLFRRDALRGVTFPVGRLHEDEFTTYKALLSGPAVLVPQPLYLYRQRDDGITASVLTPERSLDAIEAADQQADYLLAAGHFEATAWAQDQAFRKRMRLVALLTRNGDRRGAAEQAAALAASVSTGRDLPRPRVLRLVRAAAARRPRAVVRAFTTTGRVREIMRRRSAG
ncbi:MULTISPECIES: glycosyltransferase family 2 protein [unclassified Knoellia]|uniref:glycosyltransferase family 2 protein n=1 Tax=Knoellia altitudinis TaxID=3404795 RepID=UPI003610E705